jgi:hypothetical protein
MAHRASRFPNSSSKACRETLRVSASARQSQNVPVSYPRTVRFSPLQATQHADLQGFSSSPLTDSNRRPPLPWRFPGVTRVHTRSLATQFFLQIGRLEAVKMRRETSRVSFLMCPFCVRGLLSDEATFFYDALLGDDVLPDTDTLCDLGAQVRGNLGRARCMRLASRRGPA